MDRNTDNNKVAYWVNNIWLIEHHDQRGLARSGQFFWSSYPEQLFHLSETVEMMALLMIEWLAALKLVQRYLEDGSRQHVMMSASRVKCSDRGTSSQDIENDVSRTKHKNNVVRKAASAYDA